MRKVAFLIHQYGDEVLGGAESYTKALAEHLKDIIDITILTTTSNNYLTWEDYYQEGEQTADGIKVIRFSTQKKRNMDSFSKTCNLVLEKINQGRPTSKKEDEEWIREEGPYCPDMVEFVKNNKDNYDVFIVITYIYYIAVKCIPEIANKTLFIPTAHNEPWINMSMFSQIFCMPAYFGFLTEEERELVRGKFHNSYIPSEILGIGLAIPTNVNSNRFRNKYLIMDDYIIYVGRLDASKGCNELVQYFIQYKDNYESSLKLVLVGKGELDIPKREDIILTGFITDEEKYDAIAGALAMATPSPFESLCIALLESLSLGVPVIANAKCNVLKGQCIRSNAGLYYDNGEEFCKIIEYYKNNPEVYSIMKENGVYYIERRYRWASVKDKVNKIIEQICCKNENERNLLDKVRAINEIPISPIYENAVTVVFVASGDYYGFLGVTINSLIMNSSFENNYDIVVLTTDMTEEHMQEMQYLIRGRKNISLRFVDVSKYVDSLQLKAEGNYNAFTYYRFLLQEFMLEYDKVLYLDVDVVINYDIAELFYIDIEGFLLAGTYDVLIAAWQNYDSGMRAYFEALGINDPGKYIQAGVLLFNIKEMNRTFHKKYLLERACKEKYILNDQDLLNIVCRGKIRYVDLSWNVLNLGRDGKELCEKFLPSDLKRDYYRSIRDPQIVHYTERSFPCWKPERDFSDLYLEYAQRTIYIHFLELKKMKDVERNVWKRDCKLFRFINKNSEKLMVRLHRGRIISSGDINHGFKKMKFSSNVYFDKEGVQLQSGDMMYGPNIFLGSGKHFVDIYVKKENADIKLELSIVAGAGHIFIKKSELLEGHNHIEYQLKNNLVDVEFIIQNGNAGKVLLKSLSYE